VGFGDGVFFTAAATMTSVSRDGEKEGRKGGPPVPPARPFGPTSASKKYLGRAEMFQNGIHNTVGGPATSRPVPGSSVAIRIVNGGQWSLLMEDKDKPGTDGMFPPIERGRVAHPFP
jgi:hypothetical protein